MERYLDAMDLFVSTSRTQGSSNVIADAMAVGLPCIATNADDLSKIVGELGRVILCSRPDFSTKELIAAISRRSAYRPKEIRSRITDAYPAEALVDRTEEVLLNLAFGIRNWEGPAGECSFS